MNIVAADVGGTKTRLIWVNTDQPQIIRYECQYNSGEYAGMVELLTQFIADSKMGSVASGMLALALPGVVKGKNVQLTNLPWIVSEEMLKRELGVDGVLLINDFQASTQGTMLLGPDDLVELHQGERVAAGLRVVLGAGTGLGLSWMLNAKIFSTEAGHMDFAPTSSRQIQLLEFLMRKYDHVSYERLLSGAGLVTLYEFCSNEDGKDIDAAWVTSQLECDNASAIEAVSLFVEIYAAYIANIVLLFRPEGGIYITGGIAPKIINWMQSRVFVDAFYNKGRMRDLIEQSTVYVVTNERVGALGVLSIALTNWQESKNDH